MRRNIMALLSRFRRAVAEIVVVSIMVVMLLLIVIPLVYVYIQRGYSVSESSNLFLEELYRRDLEETDVLVEMISGNPTKYILINKGSVSIDITTIWVSTQSTLIPLNTRITLRPGEALDLGDLAINLSETLENLIFPTDILGMVTSRGKIISISERIYEKIFNPAILSSTSEIVIPLYSSNTLLASNFSNLIKQNRIETYYSKTVSSSDIPQCNTKADPVVGYISGYSSPLLLLRDKSYYVSISLDNKQSGCVRLIIYNISQITNLQDLFIQIKLVIAANATKIIRDPGFTFINLTIKFYNATLARSSSGGDVSTRSIASASTIINMSASPEKIIYPWQVLLKLDHRFFPVDLLREVQSMIIDIYLYRNGDARYDYIVGIEYIAAQGAILYG